MKKIKAIALKALSKIRPKLIMKALLIIAIYLLVPTIMFLVYGRLVGPDI